MTRVVVTGMGFYSPLGVNETEVFAQLKSYKNSVCIYEGLKDYQNFNTSIASPVTAALPDFPRKKVRTAGRVGRLAISATLSAITDSGLSIEELESLDCGIAYGSSGGSGADMQDVGLFCYNKDVSGLNASTYPSIMPHQTAVNLAIYFGIHGRIICTSTACTSGSQAIGYAYETIKSGSSKAMIAGGSEELSPFAIGVFDSLFATSPSKNCNLNPRPFDKNRDGIVVGEGAGTLILEEYEHAKSRGAKIYAEVIGFATNCDATHMTNPSTQHMEICIRKALKNANLSEQDIGYINAHGTATILGDRAEGSACARIFGLNTPISTLKSYMGHTLGAAGALESIFSIYMQRAKWFCPNLNLVEPDEECGQLDFIMHQGLNKETEIIMNNNFAFGGVNTSLIFRQI